MFSSQVDGGGNHTITHFNQHEVSPESTPLCFATVEVCLDSPCLCLGRAPGVSRQTTASHLISVPQQGLLYAPTINNSSGCREQVEEEERSKWEGINQMWQWL